LDIALDLIELFFGYKTFPDNYGPCRLWEVDKSNWKFYYGSNYQSYQRARLQRKVQPPEYRILFDDKAVCERLCRETGVSMPHTYGVIGPEQNYKEKIISWINSSVADALIVKPLRGSAGRGIILVKFIHNNIFIQSEKGLTPFHDFNLMEDAIVQKVLKQDSRMSAFASCSVNTVRVVTMYTKEESIIVMGATMRCGVGESYVDNWTAGGVAVGIDYETGRLKKYAYDKKGNRYVEHPTSKVVFEGFIIPEWRHIIDAAVKIQKAFPCYRILGMDIALQENGGLVLIEVNDSTDLLFQEQTSGPLFQSEPVLRAFGQYDLLVNRHQRELYDSLDSP
jgi:glutathione synthase/RimK-type ligase-like ATP-grasp enzyme